MSAGRLHEIRWGDHGRMWQPLGKLVPKTQAEAERQALWYASWIAERDGLDCSAARLWRAVWHFEHVGRSWRRLYIEAVEFCSGRPQSWSWSYGDDRDWQDVELVRRVEIPNPDPREISCINCTEKVAA